MFDIPAESFRRMDATARQIAATPATQPVPSPCIGVCRLDASKQICLGCLRHPEEIAQWSSMELAERRALWATLSQRSTTLQQTSRTASLSAPSC